MRLDDMLFALVALLAFLGMTTNLVYVLKHWHKGRFAIRVIQTLACGFVVVVLGFDAGSITDMSGISGYLLLVGLALGLSASGIYDVAMKIKAQP